MLQKLKNIGHLFVALLANCYYRFPSRQMIVIGVTGTDGKTTTANLIYQILKKSGKKVALISTIGAIIDEKNLDTGFHVTTPSPFALQKYLKMARQKGCTHAVIEVTSHALDQNRVWGIPFSVGVLTNVTHEHLDYHKSYKRYVLTKLKLFKNVSWAIINGNGEWFEQAKKQIPQSVLFSYSLHGDTDLTLQNVPFTISTKLVGDFNMENILAAIAVGIKLNIPPESIDRSIREFEPPEGRQEIIRPSNPMIMVDFAHTANAFESILKELRSKTIGRLIHVFGSAGKRDFSKRSEMGKVASFYDDVIILTSEDPRGEDISVINSQIKEGIHGFSEGNPSKKKKIMFEIPDRGEAIEFAIRIAEKDDTIVITGKGHEKTMNLGHGEIEWNDQDVVRRSIKKYL